MIRIEDIHLISIVLPIRNEEKYIRSCLEHIFAQEKMPVPYEVIAADGLSTDRTREIIHDFQKTHSNLILIDNPDKIVPCGMNSAIRKAKGDIIIRVDGHCVIDPDYVSNCVKHLVGDKVDGVGGPMRTVGETPLSEVIAIAMSSIFGVGNSAFRTITGKTILVESVPFPAYTREIINRVGLYDEELIRNQDDEYNYRIRAAGGKILLAADVRSTYYSRSSLTHLWKQYFQYGYWKVRVLQKHSRQMSLRHFIPPIFVLAMLIALVLSLIFSKSSIILVLVTGSYLLANSIASIITAMKKGWKSLPLLPVCFLILHFSYGLGFLVGLYKFWNRWKDKKGKVPEY